MGVYIKGMEMPRRGMVVNIYGDGRVTNHFDEFGKTIGKAVPVPPHGRLIDADALHYSRIRIAHNDGTIGGYNAVVMSAEIKDAPTIIEAEE